MSHDFSIGFDETTNGMTIKIYDATNLEIAEYSYNDRSLASFGDIGKQILVNTILPHTMEATDNIVTNIFDVELNELTLDSVSFEPDTEIEFSSFKLQINDVARDLISIEPVISGVLENFTELNFYMKSPIAFDADILIGTNTDPVASTLVNINTNFVPGIYEIFFRVKMNIEVNLTSSDHIISFEKNKFLLSASPKIYLPETVTRTYELDLEAEE